MAERRAIGLEYIKVGVPEADGSMSTALTALGLTYQDTAELIQDDADITEIYAEENNEPEEILEVDGVKRMNWSVMNYDPDEMVRVLGGTATGIAPNKIWEAPISKNPIELSIEYKTKRGDVVKIVRAKISAKLNWQIRKKGVALIDIAARVMTPTIADTPPMTTDRPV